MSTKTTTGKNIESLMDMLASKDGMIRQKARELLVVLGKPAVPYLNRALLNSGLEHVRWEAAKALDAIGDTRSIISLVKALEDKDSDVAWLSAEALSKFKKNAWLPLLQLLIKNGAESALLRQRSHHVFRYQKEDGFNDLIKNLLKGLESSTVPELTTVASYEFLKRIKAKL